MSKKILVVDDSASVRQQVGLALRQGGFEVVEAKDGEEGRKTVEDSPDIAMVFCDVNMPVLSGLVMLEQLKSTIADRGLPVVMLTTEGQPALIKQAKEAGAKGWIVKPFKADQLVATAKKLTA